MLEPVRSGESSRKYLRFSSIKEYDYGEGLCFVYNAVFKNTKAGKPFVTLYLRDIDGNTVPGYIFDLDDPILMGRDGKEVIGKIVLVDWRENYLKQIGMTVVIKSVSILTNPTQEQRELFYGKVIDGDAKCDEINQFFIKTLSVSFTFPVRMKTLAVPEYAHGSVGGLTDHYYKMYRYIKQMDDMAPKQYANLVATFALYIFAHTGYTVAVSEGRDDISLVTSLTKRVETYSSALKVSEGALELVQMFFGYEPKDIYVRTISAIDGLIRRVDKEFEMYASIPLGYEGDAGYGTIRRYKVEESGT